ncbi:MAG: 5-methyltetrahydropteroyltriglutamate--homocysteine S-methyltransferase [Gemmatimonadaceae bacterium]
MTLPATCLGFPRIGVARELKKSLERYWSGATTAVDLEIVATDLRRRHWLAMKEAGMDEVPTNDFALYDHVLDAAVMLGVVPSRFRDIEDPTTRYFAMARGYQDPALGVDVRAMEMTKWFDTNYHYIVPEIAADQVFTLDAAKILRDVDEARATGVKPRPVILGPVSFLLLSKAAAESTGAPEPITVLGSVLPLYQQLFAMLAKHGVEWVQLDEPCLVTDLDNRSREAYERAFAGLTKCSPRPLIMLTTYFGSLNENLSLATRSGCDALHVDLVRAPEQLGEALSALPPAMSLSTGLVSGRDIWRTDLDRAHAMCRRAVTVLGTDRVRVATSCSMLHVPVDVEAETKLDVEVKSWLSFAAQKLGEIRALADAATEVVPSGRAFDEARAILSSRRASPRTHDKSVRDRVASVTQSMLTRSAPFAERAAAQHARFGLPQFPTTTIGSFPQTSEIRAARAAWRAHHITDADYETFLKQETARCIAAQETLDLDVLVHGEFERNDMVEHFGERLAGFAFTKNGWVQSYGSRCVKPPIIFGDVMRPRPMTVDWATYAQSLTTRPVKGMLTGPLTILQWSFVRDDQPRSETCVQIALALRDELADLERAGISVIQVDEPAIREGLPLRRKDWAGYLRWAVDAFRLTTSVVMNDTQIHTHMCYSEFGEILGAIIELDADVLSIESSRSNMELLSDFARVGYPNEIGPGVYDIHSPRVPSTDEIFGRLEMASNVLSSKQLWVNPDCGLKTREWSEVNSSLKAMVAAAKRARAQLGAR